MKENYKIIDVLKIIYQANKLGIWLWIQDDKLKFKSQKGIDVSEIMIKLKQQKNEVLKILQNTKIFSDNFTQPFIYRTSKKRTALSYAQERLWFIEQYEEGTNAYHIPIAYELGVNTDIKGIKYAIQQVVSRHEVLRTTIKHDSNQEHDIQVVHDEPLPIEEISLKHTEDYESIIKADINQPFNLDAEYPLRVKLYTIESDKTTVNNDKNKTLLLINIHHIASDGWSMEIFQRELFAYYEAYINNDSDFSLPALEIQYKDYALWQRAYLSGEVLETQLRYWKDKLVGYQPLELPTDYSRPSKLNYSGAHQSFTLHKEINQKLRALAKDYGVTLHSLLLSSINILLNKYTGQEDIVIGSPIANRHHHQTEKLIGFFVNMQTHRTILNQTQSFVQLIQQVHKDQIEAQLHQDLPFEKLVNELGIERDPSRHPIFQVMFGVHSFSDQSKTKEQQNTYLQPFEIKDAYEVEKFDLSIFIKDSAEELIGFISYASSLFAKDTIARLIEHYTHLLEQLVEAPQKPYSQISLLNSDEYNKIVYEWNATDKAYPKDKTIYQIFQEQVEKTPNKIALVCEGEQLTYKELNEKSNQLARHIRKQYQQRTKQELKPNTLIALCLDRSIEMIIGILAVLKAGGAYVPIDINYPQERIDYILEDTKTELILSQKHLNKEHTKLPQHKIINIDLTQELYNKEDSSNLAQYSQATDLAYIIYTSGTTGKPKGVMIEHKAVTNYVNNVKEVLLADIKHVDFSTNLAFDLTVTTTLTSLLLGKTIYIYSGELSDTNKYARHLIQNKIDFIKNTPSLLANLPLDYFLDHKIKQAFAGGEKLEQAQLYHLLKYINNLIDEYGPTETTVGTSYITKNIFNQHKGIGKPYFNYKTYILDSDQNPVPIGVIGELYIGGAGLARGYLNRPELTQERFIPNPFATEQDQIKGYTRLYKTGDLARWLADGNIEYIGRNDDQVKIRGYRIELGEIEHALSQIPGIKQSCVLSKERKTAAGTTKYLVAYYVLHKNASTLKQDTILEKLSKVLPEYMVPSIVVAIESFPLTINGKLDKRALPDPNFNVPARYVAPTTEVEVGICNIWQEVLGLEKVGVTDDFFKIGGNSILAIQVAHRMSKLLSLNIRVVDLFKYKSIAILVRKVVLYNEVDTSNLILLSGAERKNKPCMFLIHGVGGNILSYYKIIQRIETKYNLYGIQSSGLEPDENYFSSYTEMIQEYAEEISLTLKRLKTNTYNIIGWSYGVPVALDLIDNLSDEYHCNHAFLIDGSPIDSKDKEDNNIHLNANDLTENLRTLLSEFKKSFGFEDEISHMTRDELFMFAHNLFGYPYTEEDDPATIERRISVALNNIKNLLNHFKHTHTPYKAEKFHIINATKTNNIYNKWNTILSSDHIETIDILTDHWSIMTSDTLLNYLYKNSLNLLKKSKKISK